MRIAIRCTCAVQVILLFVCLQAVAFAGQFHDQAPMTNAEVEQFITDFPAFKQWMFVNKGSAKPMVDAAGKPSFQWDEKTASWFTGKNWTPERFFYVMTHCSAGVMIIRHGDKLTGPNHPSDMPEVSEYEMNLVRQYEEPLLRSLSTKVQ